MAEEEFMESELIFHENATGIDEANHNNFAATTTTTTNNNNNKKLKKRKKVKKSKSSPPINIPNNILPISANNAIPYVDSDLFDDDDDYDCEITPPHIILGRRVAEKMAFSVCTGNGRTLKGRDQCHFRNSILRMTGFIEA